MVYKQKLYENLIGIEGLSENLLRNHFTLYQGYVANINKIIEILDILLKEGKTGPEFSELKRRLGWEFNGMRLHEYYFENLCKERKKIDKNSKIFKKLEEDFTSFENWEKEFRAIGAMRGIGWVILCLDVQADKLFNIWIGEHDTGHLCGVAPLLVMDVFEHAYMTDYQLNKTDYIQNFFSQIDWDIINKRLQKANYEK